MTFAARGGSPGALIKPLKLVQHASPSWVSQSLDWAHWVGHAAVAVHTAWARSPQHLGVAPEQSLSLEQPCWQAVVGAHTRVVDPALAWQHDSPMSVAQSVSWLQKRGHAWGVTQALLPDPKSQHSSPCPLQSESAPQLFGQLDTQSAWNDVPVPLGPPVLLPLHARTAARATASATRVPHTRSFIMISIPLRRSSGKGRGYGPHHTVRKVFTSVPHEAAEPSSASSSSQVAE